jgi:hypothetical protein
MLMKAPLSSQEYWIASEPRGAAFETLLSYCAAVGSYCSLVDQFPHSKKGREARERFLETAKPYLLRIDDVSSWPGSGVLKGTAPLWRFTMGSGLNDLLVAQSKGLYDFQAPKLPEDLAVYRADGSVLLGSVAHEHMGWMNLTDEEKADRWLGLVELRSRGG